MPIIRFINDRNRKDAQLLEVINYIKREDKLAERYITGLGVETETAYRDMMVAKKMLHQEKGKQYLHLVVSCDRKIRNPDAVHGIGKEIACFYKDYQVLLATHSDTDNLHCHLVINSVNMRTGKKLSQRRKDFWEFRKFANTVFERHNLPHIGEKQIYEIVVGEGDYEGDAYDWEEDEFGLDQMITDRAEELQNRYGIQRPIYFVDEEEERFDLLRSINRLEEAMDLQGEDYMM